MEDGARRGALFRLSLTAPLGTSACGVRPRVVPTVQRKGVHTTSHGVFGFALASRTHTQLGTSKRFPSMRRTHHADAAGRRSRQWSRQARGRHMNRFEHHSKHLQTHMGGSRFFCMFLLYIGGQGWLSPGGQRPPGATGCHFCPDDFKSQRNRLSYSATQILVVIQICSWGISVRPGTGLPCFAS